MGMSDKTKRIEVIGFDLDGTLYPLTKEIQGRIRGLIYGKISDEFNIPYQEAMRRFEEEYSKINSGSRAVENIAEHFKKRINGKDLVQSALQEADILDLIEENYELDKMLNRLNERYMLDLITGSKYSLAEKKIKRLGINKDVFGIVLSHDSGSKTEGDIYKKWVIMRKTHPERVLYVGDNSKQDIDSPKRLGIRTCIVGDYKEADFRIRNILELEEVLK